MTFGERDQLACGSKASPFPDSSGVITYKRRRRGCGDSGGTQSGGSEAEITRLSHDISISIGAKEPDTLGRIANNWRNALESVLQSEEVEDDSVAKSCILKALVCSPFGSFNQLNVATEGSSRGTQNGDTNHDIDDHLTIHSIMSSKGNSETSLHGYDNMGDRAGINTTKCQNALCDILTSEKFALLCDLLDNNFKSKDVSSLIGLSLIFAKMKKGTYEHSSDFFHQDLQLIWEKFLTIGQEMVLLASNLLVISRDSYQRKVGKTPGPVPTIHDKNHDINEIFHSMQLESGYVTNQQSTKESVRDATYMDSYTTTVVTSHESDPSTKAEPTHPSCPYKVSTCHFCGLEADGEKSLICDGCETVHHVSCIKPPVLEIPKRTWYCAACSLSRGESVLPTLTCGQQDRPHQNCVVCKRLNDSGAQAKTENNPGKVSLPSSSRECSVSSMEDDESSEPSRTAMMRLCKQCGTCEDDDKRFLLCSNKHCLYKYYHIRCLKSTQLATKHQPPDRWYCPSCLCRGCLVDKDDDLICLCDACDEGYHIYCMNPSRSSVPKGTWYCFTCSMERAKKGMRMYEQWVLQNHGKNGAKASKQPDDEKPGSKVVVLNGNKRNR